MGPPHLVLPSAAWRVAWPTWLTKLLQIQALVITGSGTSEPQCISGQHGSSELWRQAAGLLGITLNVLLQIGAWS